MRIHHFLSCARFCQTLDILRYKRGARAKFIHKQRARKNTKEKCAVVCKRACKNRRMGLLACECKCDIQSRRCEI
jgi:hypothetical protein